MEPPWKIFLSVSFGVVMLTACQLSPQSTVAPTPIQLSATAMLTQTSTVGASDSITPSSTATAHPSDTLSAAQTPSPFPSATIFQISNTPASIFTPTFDTRTIVTVTPAQRAECPKEHDSLKLNFKINDDQTDVSQQMLKFLNSGGSMKTVVNELTKVSGNSWFKFSDLTNDAQPDLVFIGFQQAVDTFYILWCQEGQYVRFAGKMVANNIYQIVDMNKNGMPEIVMYSRGCSGAGCYRFIILEWDGETFVDLTTQAGNEGIYLDGVDESEIDIRDLNQDGTLELKLTSGFYDRSLTRWIEETHIYIWNGNYFAEQPTQSLNYTPATICPFR